MNKLPLLQKTGQLGKKKDPSNHAKAPLSHRNLVSRQSSSGAIGPGVKKPPTGYQFATPN